MAIYSLPNAEHRDSREWWLTWHGQAIGPYGTKKDAAEARRGLNRFDEHRNDRSYFTTEPEPEEIT